MDFGAVVVAPRGFVPRAPPIVRYHRAQPECWSRQSPRRARANTRTSAPMRFKVHRSELTSIQYLIRTIPERTNASSTRGHMRRTMAPVRPCRSPSLFRPTRDCTGCGRKFTTSPAAGRQNISLYLRDKMSRPVSCSRRTETIGPWSDGTRDKLEFLSGMAIRATTRWT